MNHKRRNLFKLLVLMSILFTVMNGCAFKKEKKAVEVLNQVTQTNYRLSIDWTYEGDNRTTELLKATRNLSIQDRVITVNEPVTIPAKVPETLTLKLELPLNSFRENSVYSKAVLKFASNQQVEIVAQVNKESVEGEKKIILFQITDLDSIFKMDRSQSALLRIEFYSPIEKGGSFEIGLRTPPKELLVTEISLKDFQNSLQADENYNKIQPKMGGTQLTFIKAVEFKNNENESIEIKTPRRFFGFMTQQENYYFVIQEACSYRTANENKTLTYAENLILLPLDERFFSEGNKLLSDQNQSGVLSTTIESGKSIKFGFYGASSRLDLWLTNGPAKSESETIQAIKGCNNVCAEHYCEPRDRHFTLNVESCPCIRWINEMVSIPSGVVRGPVTLNLEPQLLSIPIRYGDLDQHMDGEFRSLNAFENMTVVSW